MSISKRTRFEVFKRDEFTCQYCGKNPPSVILEIDHIIPKSKEGLDDIENLITACFDCNRGKSNVLITEIKDRQVMSDSINKIKEQEDQLKEYYKLIAKKEKRINKEVKEIGDFWSNCCEDKYSLNEIGLSSIKKFLKTFNKEKIKEAIILSIHIVDIENRFKYMCGILHNWIREINGDFSRKHYYDLLNYWRKQPRGSGYLPYNNVKKWLEEYEITEIQKAMDDSLGHWSKLRELLDS